MVKISINDPSILYVPPVLHICRWRKPIAEVSSWPGCPGFWWAWFWESEWGSTKELEPSWNYDYQEFLQHCCQHHAILLWEYAYVCLCHISPPPFSSLIPPPSPERGPRTKTSNKRKDMYLKQLFSRLNSKNLLRSVILRFWTRILLQNTWVSWTSFSTDLHWFISEPYIYVFQLRTKLVVTKMRPAPKQLSGCYLSICMSLMPLPFITTCSHCELYSA